MSDKLMCVSVYLYTRTLRDAYHKWSASHKRLILDISGPIQRRRVRPVGLPGYILHVTLSGLTETLDIYLEESHAEEGKFTKSGVNMS